MIRPQHHAPDPCPHPATLVWDAPKLEQFRSNLKLRPLCQTFRNPINPRVLKQFGGQFQFWSSSFVPNCPNWPKGLQFQGLDSLDVFRKKTPSPYGREGPYGGPLSGRGCWLAMTSFPLTNQEVTNGSSNQSAHSAQS